MAASNNHDPSGILQWFDELERTTIESAKRCGLIGHPTLVGNAREFLIHEFLEAFLPTAVEVGAGIVIDRVGGRSRQVDVIVYDSRFPKLRLPGGSAMYLAIGVVATIEVKSALNTNEIANSIRNCRSVLNLQHELASHDMTSLLCDFQREDSPFTNIIGDEFDPLWTLQSYLYPTTYVVGFEGMSFNSTVDALENEAESCVAKALPMFPRIVLSPGVIGILRDACMSIHASDPSIAPNVNAMALFPVPEDFLGLKWLGVHLLWTINRRLGTRHSALNVDIGFDGFLNIQPYFIAEMKDLECVFVLM